MSSASSAAESLYIHVPFCARKCEYCAFYSRPGSGDEVNRYVAALVGELSRAAALRVGALPPPTVFFGGGTPSLLNPAQWRVVFAAFERLGLLGAPEWTIECNPSTVSADKARLFREYGVSRISMGVQSFDDALLERLGRVHTRAAALASYDTLRSAGFDNLNLDLMFAIPGQDMDAWLHTLDQAIALGPEHLACYEVIYEEDTPLFAQLRAGQFDADEDLAADMYEALVDRLGEAGYVQYEVANFARPARPTYAALGAGRLEAGSILGRHARAMPADVPEQACRHNVNYWRGGSFFGLGPSATSYLDGVRSKNWPDTKVYCDLVESGSPATASSERLGPLARAGETAAFGLRMTAGWPFAEFERVTGFDLRREWAPDLARLVEQGHGEMSAERFRLTRRGLRFADAAAELLLRPDGVGHST
jgi:oxygen-independent coproporphyrinogen-3 oxidase